MSTTTKTDACFDPVVTQKRENFIKIYSNNVTVGVSKWDINLVFGEIIGLNDEGVPIVEQSVKVNMTREFAKAVCALIKNNIEHYEKTFGRNARFRDGGSE